MSTADSARFVAGFIGRLIVAGLLGFASGLLVIFLNGALIYLVVLTFDFDLAAIMAIRAQEVTLVYGAFVGWLIALLVLAFDQYLLDEKTNKETWWLAGAVTGGLIGYLVGADLNPLLAEAVDEGLEWAIAFSRVMAISSSLAIVALIVGPALGLAHGVRWQRANMRRDEDRARTDAFTAFLQRRRKA